MGARRGQSTVESIALIVLVGLSMAVTTATLVRGTTIRAVIDAIRAGIAPADAPPDPSDAALAYLDRALTPADDTPTLHDAALRLEGEIGRERASALVLATALRRHLPRSGHRARALADPALALARPDLDGVGPPDAGVWSLTEQRAAPTVRLVAADAERAWRASLVPSHPQRIADVAASSAAAAFGALNPATAAAVLISGALTAAGADVPRGAPPAARADDLVLCQPVWRTNHAIPPWVDAHPHEAVRLRLGERVAAVELTVVRAGRVIQRAVVRSDATRC